MGLGPRGVSDPARSHIGSSVIQDQKRAHFLGWRHPGPQMGDCSLEGHLLGFGYREWDVWVALDLLDYPNPLDMVAERVRGVD